ncbi:MAG: proteinase inhibitor I78 [Giesbergeria sp.]|nr:proteinase inhibitor I78 [Giesbergeria sp.]
MTRSPTCIRTYTRATLAAVLGAAALLAGCAAPTNVQRGAVVSSPPAEPAPPRISTPMPPPPPAEVLPQWQTPGPQGGACDAAPAERFIGQQATASVMENARKASGATTARVLRPNQATTREFNHERLNLRITDQGRITSVNCG